VASPVRARAALWIDGKQILDLPSGNIFEDGLGVAVGGSYVGGKLSAWLYRDGTVSRLSGEEAWALGINDHGVVIGMRALPDAIQRPLVWRSLGDTAQDLPLPAGAVGGMPRDIDTDATIVGIVNLTDRDPGHGYLWLPDGQHRQLPMPTVDGVQAVSYLPTAVHNGIVDGIAYVDIKNRTREVPVLLDLRTNTFTIPIRDVSSPVGNGRGWLAGGATDGAVLTDGVTRIVLTPLAPPVAGDPIATSERRPQIKVLSDDARVIAGQALDVNGVTRAVVWRCD
jgi:hypothetical protein